MSGRNTQSELGLLAMDGGDYWNSPDVPGWVSPEYGGGGMGGGFYGYDYFGGGGGQSYEPINYYEPSYVEPVQVFDSPIIQTLNPINNSPVIPTTAAQDQPEQRTDNGSQTPTANEEKDDSQIIAGVDNKVFFLAIAAAGVILISR